MMDLKPLLCRTERVNGAYLHVLCIRGCSCRCTEGRDWVKQKMLTFKWIYDKKNSPAKTPLFCMWRLKLQIKSKLWCICSTKVLSTIIIVCINGKLISFWGWLMGFFKRIVHTKNENYVITYSFSCHTHFPSSVEHNKYFEGLFWWSLTFITWKMIQISQNVFFKVLQRK